MVPRDQFLATGVTRTQSSTAVCENSPSCIFSSLSLRGRSKCSTVTSLVCLPALSKRDLTSSVHFTFNFADSHWQRHDTLLLFFHSTFSKARLTHATHAQRRVDVRAKEVARGDVVVCKSMIRCNGWPAGKCVLRIVP